MTTQQKRTCKVCKKEFATIRGRRNHQAAAHKAPHPESFASRAIQAELDQAMGIYNPDQEWLLS